MKAVNHIVHRPSEEPIRVAFLDCDQGSAQGEANLLSRPGLPYCVIPACKTADEFLQVLTDHRPQVGVLEIDIVWKIDGQWRNGVQLLRHISNIYADVTYVVRTSWRTPRDVLDDAKAAGAHAILWKQRDAPTLHDVIGWWRSHRLSYYVHERTPPGADDLLPLDRDDGVDPALCTEERQPPPRCPLSSRLLDVVALLAFNLDNKTIAKILSCSPHTVKEYIETITAQYKVDTGRDSDTRDPQARTRVVEWCFTHGWLTRPYVRHLLASVHYEPDDDIIDPYGLWRRRPHS